MYINLHGISRVSFLGVLHNEDCSVFGSPSSLELPYCEYLLLGGWGFAGGDGCNHF